MQSIIFTKVDMITVSRNSRAQRKAAMSAPVPGVTFASYASLARVDDFYNECQNMRDFYTDPLYKMPKPMVFHQHYGKCELQDKNVELLSLPANYVRQYLPMLCPVEYGRDKPVDGAVPLGGRYDANSSTVFKR